MKPARNDPCPCGSGKKYKKCCIDKDEDQAAVQINVNAASPSKEECDRIINLYNSGDKAELETSARLLVERYPQSGVAWKLWGATLQLLGKDCLAALKNAAELLPHDAETHNLLGMTLSDMGRKSEAATSFRRALQLNAQFAAAHCNLANILGDEGKLDEAEASLRLALKINPNIAEAHQNLGAILRKFGRLDEAEEFLLRALQLKPDFPDAFFNIGAIHGERNELDEAESSFNRALELQPRHVPSLISLGNIVAKRGEHAKAEELFQLAIHINPMFTEAHIGLSLTLFDQGRLEGAEAILKLAIKTKPDDGIAYSNLGTVLMRLHRLEEAAAAFHQALQFRPTDAAVYSGLGSTLNSSGKPAEAEVAYRMALQVNPGFADAHSNLLSMLNFRPEARGEEIIGLARAFDQKFCLPQKQKWPTHTNSKDPDRRLRIGYVSADFRHHAVAYFLEPVLANHDKSKVEVFCYSGVKAPDEYTDRFQSFSDHWRSTRGVSDDAVAKTIVDDQVDILVDLAGHTDGNRLMVFARKPAPIQMTYLGYPGTTGLTAIEYRVVDANAAPEGMAEASYTERLLRMPDSLWCYRPTADMPEPSALPALTAGHVTFGSFNNFNKIDQPTIELWAELLRAIPGSRLMMVTVPAGEVRQRLIRQFAELGVEDTRLEFHGKISHTEFHRKFLDVDISLDPVNVNGATTTCESLWMGVPVISLVGSRFLMRAGLSLLSAAGVAEFAANSRERYVEIAAELSKDLPRLSAIRAGLRSRLRASPLTDEAAFAANLEQLYRQVWKSWCQTA